MLLPTDADCRHVVEATGGLDGAEQGGPPVVRMHLGAIGMGGLPLPQKCPADGVADDDLAGLGGGVDAGHESGPMSHGRGC